MTTTVFNVASYILNTDNKNFGLLRLIKLCYLSYGWYFAYHGEALFKERIEAWKYGPVIPELYYSLRHFNGSEIPKDCLEKLSRTEKEYILSENMQQLIDAVVDYYGEYSGVELSALTHKKGSPWHETYKGLGRAWGRIPDNIIKNHFDKLKEQLGDE